MTKEQKRNFRIAYQWWGLSAKQLKPFLSDREWAKLLLFSKELAERYGVAIGARDYKKAASNNEWPDDAAEIWDALK